MNKIIAGIVGVLLLTHVANAQSWMANIKPDSARNFYAIKRAFDNYWETTPPVKEENEESEGEHESFTDESYNQFERWANFMAPRVFPSGNLFNPSVLQKEFEKYKASASVRSTQSNSTTWSFLGPDIVPGGGGGAGRVNCVKIAPADTNTIFVGAASGGLWVTHNGGTTWSTTTDLLPALSIADIAINPNHTDTMYAATGDGYGYVVPEGNVSVFWGGTYSTGVMKSTDGGLTWSTTGLSYPDDSLNIINRLLIYPNNPNILLAATHDGIYRTTDAGTSWVKVDTGTVFDIEFNTANADTVYAAHATDIYKSTNVGATWFPITNGLFSASDRVTIGTTAANSRVIYALNVVGSIPVTGNLYESINGGNTFFRDTFPAAAGFYGYYDGVMSVSPTNANTLYCGGLELVKSINGGIKWVIADNTDNYRAADYVHVDKHAITFYPNSNGEILCGNDGGLFKTTNGDENWKDLSNGLAIKQYYRISSSALDTNYIYAGSQDNGTDEYKDLSWQMVYGNDGMQPLIDYTSNSIVYVSYQDGELLKSTDSGETFNDITPDVGGGTCCGNWTTPYLLNPTHHNTIIAGYTDVVRSYDGGNTWTDISGNSITLFNGVGQVVSINSLVMAPSDTNYIYAATYADIMRTTDDGNTWTDITGSLPVSKSALTWIAVSSYDPQKLWVTFSGYQDGIKIFESTNGGNTWTNYSGTLPNIPVDCITYQPGSKGLLYAGTDFGVFMRDSTMSDWAPFNTGLPNVIIDQLEIVPNTSRLRAATYGRGIWETDLYNDATGIAPVSSSEDNINVFPNPSNGLLTVAINSQQPDNFSLTVINILGQTILETQKQVQAGNNQFDLDISKQAKGLYFICVRSSTQNMVKKITVTD